MTSDGYPMNPQITVPAGATSVTISKSGIVSATIAGQTAPQELGTIELASFRNPAGLRSLGGNLFQAIIKRVQQHDSIITEKPRHQSRKRIRKARPLRITLA